MSIGVGALFGLLFLFIGCTNKFAYQSKWDPNDTENNQKLENVSHILPAHIQEENKAGTEETDQLVAKAGLSLQVICKSNSFTIIIISKSSKIYIVIASIGYFSD